MISTHGNPGWTKVIGYGNTFYDVSHYSSSWTNAAGEMYSTVGDLGRAISQLATGSTLRDQGRTELTNWVKTGNSYRYGFCIAEIQGGIGHTGDVPGFNAVAAYFPKLQKSVVVMTNLSNNKDGKTMPTEELLKLILDNLR